jgi:hypothetical protein
MKERLRRRIGTSVVLLLIGILAGQAALALMSGRLGWRNYWGGFVFAPFVLIVVVLSIIMILKHRGIPLDRPRRRRR